MTNIYIYEKENLTYYRGTVSLQTQKKKKRLYALVGTTWWSLIKAKALLKTTRKATFWRLQEKYIQC